MNKEYGLVVITGPSYVGRHALIVETMLHKLEQVVVVCKLEDVDQIRNVSDENKTMFIFVDPCSKDQDNENNIMLNLLREKDYLQTDIDEILALVTEQRERRKDFKCVVNDDGDLDKVIDQVKVCIEKFFKITPPVP